MIAGRQRSIVQLGAEVARVDVCDHLTLVAVGGQGVAGELVQRMRFRAGDLDRAVQRRPDRDVGEAAATSSDAMGCIRAGDRRTASPSVPDWTMPPTNSKNCVERTIV